MVGNVCAVESGHLDGVLRIAGVDAEALRGGKVRSASLSDGTNAGGGSSEGAGDMLGSGHSLAHDLRDENFRGLVVPILTPQEQGPQYSKQLSKVLPQG